MEQRKIFVDVAHASQNAIVELVKIATRPILSSHTGTLPREEDRARSRVLS
jgi:microsomal dipeptidase-like Zn-dependent dipeptidase